MSVLVGAKVALKAFYCAMITPVWYPNSLVAVSYSQPIPILSQTYSLARVNLRLLFHE